VGQGRYSAPSKPMIDPSRPPPLPLVGGVVVGGGVVGGGVVGGVLVGGLVVGGVVVGGVVCLDFDGLAEDGWLAGLDDFPDFPVPGVDSAPLLSRAPFLPWVFLCPERDGLGVLTPGAACADGWAGATAELTGGEAWCSVFAASMAPPPNIANTATSTPAAGTNAAGPRRAASGSSGTGNPGRVNGSARSAISARS
jgi:hypothetical protein